MIIFHLITSIDNGGAENHLASLVKEQAKNNEVFVIYLRGNNYWKKKLEDNKIKVYRFNLEKLFNIFGLIAVILKICNLIKTFKPNILHAHLSSMELIGAILKLIFKDQFKLVVTKHLDSFFFEASYGQNNFFKGLFIDKFIFNKADKIICISNQIKKYFLKRINISKKKIYIVYYGLNTSDLKKKRGFSLSKIELNQLKNTFTICCIARHVKQKSIDFLIKSFSEFKKKNYKSKLILIGNGPETKKLKILAKKLNIIDHIIWINYVENVLRILKISNVFVLPSKYEGFGLVLLEAMYAKVPIIATKVSAIPEVIRDDWNGLLIKHGSVKDFQKKLEIIKKNKNNLKFIKNSQKTLIQKFNFNRMILETSKIYLEAKNVK